jgi:hypothetical protein
MYARLVFAFAAFLYIFASRAHAAELSLNAIGTVGLGQARLVADYAPPSRSSSVEWQPQLGLSAQLELSVLPYLGVVAGAGSQYSFQANINNSSNGGVNGSVHGFAPFWEAGLLQRFGDWHVQETIGVVIDFARRSEEASVRLRVMHEIADLFVIGYEARAFSGNLWTNSSSVARDTLGIDHGIVLGISL